MDVRLPDGTVISNVPDDISKAALTAKLASSGYDVSGLQAQQPVGNRLAPVKAPARGIATAMSQTPTGQLLSGITEFGGVGSGLIKGVKDMTIDPLQNLTATALHKLGIISDEQLKAYDTEQQQAKQQYEEDFRPNKVAEFAGAMAVPLPGGRITEATRLARAAKSAMQGAVMGGAAAAGTGEVSNPEYVGDVLKAASMGAVAAPVLGAATKGIGLGMQGMQSWIRNKFTAAEEEYLNRLVEKNPKLGFETVNALRAGAVPPAAIYAHAQETLPEKYFPSEFVGQFREKSKELISKLSNIGSKVPVERLQNRLKTQTKPLYERFDKTAFNSDAKLESILDRYRRTISTGAPADIATIRETPIQIGQYVPAGTAPVLGAGGVPLLGPSGNPILRTTGATFPKYTGSGLSDIRKDMASKINPVNPTQAIDSNLRGAVIGLRNELTEWMEQKSPNVWAKARDITRGYGKLVDQKKVADYLHGKLKNTLDEGLPVSSTSFLNALDEVAGTLKRSTGEPRYKTWGDLFSPKQMEAINSIGKQASQQAHLEQRAASGARAHTKTAAEENVSLHMLNRGVTIIEGLMAGSGKHISEQVKKRVAGMMLHDPAAAADALETAVGARLEHNRRKAMIAEATDIARQLVKKPLAKAVFSYPQEKRDRKATIQDLNAKYEAGMLDLNTRNIAEAAPEQAPPPDLTVEDMAERYRALPVEPNLLAQ